MIVNFIIIEWKNIHEIITHKEEILVETGLLQEDESVIGSEELFDKYKLQSSELVFETIFFLTSGKYKHQAYELLTSEILNEITQYNDIPTCIEYLRLEDINIMHIHSLILKKLHFGKPIFINEIENQLKAYEISLYNKAQYDKNYAQKQIDSLKRDQKMILDGVIINEYLESVKDLIFTYMKLGDNQYYYKFGVNVTIENVSEEEEKATISYFLL